MTYQNKYFRRTIVATSKELEGVIKLPNDFFDFYSSHEPTPFIYKMKPKDCDGIGLGFPLNGKIYLFSGFLNQTEFENEVQSYKDASIRRYGLLKIANNQFAEGGFYIGVGEENFNNVFFYKTYIDWAEKKDVVKLSNSFSEFINALKPVCISFTRLGTKVEFLNEIKGDNEEIIGLER